MKKFNITVNGKLYKVEVEEIREDVTSDVSEPKSKPSPSSKPVDLPIGVKTIPAPMPGTILDIKVKEGQPVKKGDVLLILEAMKMENEIAASFDGIIASINVSKGTSVNTGDALVTIK
ncbi:biotin/lipoyl-binding protein [Aceticella autotrophica]|uniref:Biotin/lipoyl-binding protein n=1 Tax=Aceticella autotrophica TaxID=2755338 RepID=A0A975AVI7_9THEO|nr:biotin/lipoyl-containing protein [Aceticella autotrophica]QSZ27216.1 biotin/lipoyl-binding protein [Aceticella autotrophica]